MCVHVVSTNSNLTAKKYTITLDYDVLTTGSFFGIRKINGILYAKGAFSLTVDSLTGWENTVIGQVTDWDNSAVANLLLITTIGHDIPTLAINISSSGEIIVTTQETLSSVSGRYFYGNGIHML